MLIQINTDKNIKGSEALSFKLTELISGELDRFSSHITRVEVHLSDENSHKSGVNDKRCVLEARLEKRKPIAVTSQADTVELAVDSAVEKLKNSLTTIISRLKDHKSKGEKKNKKELE